MEGSLVDGVVALDQQLTRCIYKLVSPEETQLFLEFTNYFAHGRPQLWVGLPTAADDLLQAWSANIIHKFWPTVGV